jgi:thiol-disulfide isomerase/thioredoxin
LNGEVVLIHFWASWCEACKAEMPELNSFAKDHRTDGLHVLLVNADDTKGLSRAREMMKSYSLPWALVKDTDFKNYGRIWRLPLTFVIDRKGILRKDGWAADHALTKKDLDAEVLPLVQAK